MNANVFKSYMVSSYSAKYWNSLVSNVRSGDFIAVDFTSDGTINHVGFVHTKSGGKLRFVQHTRSYLNWDGGWLDSNRKGTTIVYAVKGNRLQLVPLLAVLVGLVILVYRFWWNTSALYAPFCALMACGVVAALIQLLVAMITTSQRSRKIIAIVDTTVIIITLLTIVFGEYICCDVLKLPVISYAWSPGTQINTVATILAGAVVTLLVFWEQCKTRRQ